ncbi:MAG: tetratricopeptide repeat protein [Verrucomicrobiaceae bacterium]|nr:MAG: tetratricopeptide repeat protein [Verrucomicrobiaceae bacterium]
MNRFFIICLACLCGAAAPALADGRETFDRANAMFEAGDFAGAAAAYQKILLEHGPRAPVYYNLGNSHLRMGDYGHAILAYERAKLLTPRDPDLRSNLALARKNAAAFEEEPGLHPRVAAALHFLSRDEWSWLVGGGAILLGGLGLLCGVARVRRGCMARVMVVSAALAALVILVASVVLYLRRGEAARGVIVAADAVLRLSPFETAEPLATPAPGRTVRLGEKSGDFRFIEIPGTNLQGWLADKDVASVIPQDE